MALLRGGSSFAQQVAATALGNLAFNAADNRVDIVSAGAIQPFEALARGRDAGAQKTAAWALANLHANPRIALSLLAIGRGDGYALACLLAMSASLLGVIGLWSGRPENKG